jgi:hypothetical protein
MNKIVSLQEAELEGEIHIAKARRYVVMLNN